MANDGCQPWGRVHSQTDGGRNIEAATVTKVRRFDEGRSVTFQGAFTRARASAVGGSLRPDTFKEAVQFFTPGASIGQRIPGLDCLCVDAEGSVCP